MNDESLIDVRRDLEEWAASGIDSCIGAVSELPASAVYFALACHGRESNPVGTYDTLMAVSDECDECHGDGSHCDDGHPGNAAVRCEHCGGHGRVPKGTGQRTREDEATGTLQFGPATTVMHDPELLDRAYQEYTSRVGGEPISRALFELGVEIVAAAEVMSPREGEDA